MPKTNINWGKAKNFYTTSVIRPTLNEVAEKFGVSRPSVARHSGAEDWPEARERFESETAARVNELRIEQAAEANLDSLGTMESQLLHLTDIQEELIKEFERRVADDEGLEGISAKDLVDAVSKIAKAQDNGVRAISFLKGGADSRTEMTFAELAALSKSKKEKE